MAIVFKKTLRENPRDPSKKNYYPELLTLGKSVNQDTIAYEMKEKSSLSKGDILSVLSNFVEAMLSSLYNGHSVNIQNFGVFSLSASTVGAAEEKDCTAKNIKAVRINFRPSTSVRPNLTSTRAGNRLEFVDLQTYLKSLKMSLSDEGDDSNNDGGNDDGNGGGDDFIDPSA